MLKQIIGLGTLHFEEITVIKQGKVSKAGWEGMLEKRDRILELITRFMQKIVHFLFGLIISALLVLSGFSTCVVLYNNGGEHVVYIGDNMAWNLIFGIGVLLAIVAAKLLYDRFSSSKMCVYARKIGTYRNIRRLGLFVLFLAGFLLVYYTRLDAKVDQYYIMDAAHALRIGDYNPFLTDGNVGYVARYPHQAGIVVFLYFLGEIIGDYNYVGFQLINVIALAGIYKTMLDIAKLWGIGHRRSILLLLLEMAFIPLVMYTTFVYGTLIGLALSLAAIKNELKFFLEKKYRFAVAAAIEISLAVVIKNNYLIFMLGMLLAAMVEAFRKKDTDFLIALAFIVIACESVPKLPAKFIENKTGVELSEGISSIAWVAMGLQENDERANGWYNNFLLSSYFGAGRDSSKQSIAAMREIVSRFGYFSEHKLEAVDFFAKKTASEWNDPTFQGHWILQYRNSELGENRFAVWLTSVPVLDIMLKFTNRIHFIILLGAFLSLLFGDKKWLDHSIVFEIIFIGGFIFHFFWEAKGQYTLPYFVLLLPFAAQGVASVCNLCVGHEPLKEKISWKMLIPIAVVMAVALLSSSNEYLQTMFRQDMDTQEYEWYLNGEYSAWMLLGEKTWNI